MNRSKPLEGLDAEPHVSVVNLGIVGHPLRAKKEPDFPMPRISKTLPFVRFTAAKWARDRTWPENIDNVFRTKPTALPPLRDVEGLTNELAFASVDKKTPLFQSRSSCCTDEDLGLSDCDTRVQNRQRCDGLQSLQNNIEIIEDIEREVSKRVISGMVLTSRCGREIENIFQKHLTKRIGTFLDKPLPSSMTSPKPAAVRFPNILSAPASVSQRRNRPGRLKPTQLAAKVYSESLKIVYPSTAGNCRYIRAPLSPVPSVEWVFEGCCQGGREKAAITPQDVFFQAI